METMFTISQVAKMLTVSIPTINRELKDARIGAIKVRGQWRFTQENIDDYLESRTIKAKRKKAVA